MSLTLNLLDPREIAGMLTLRVSRFEPNGLTHKSPGQASRRPGFSQQSHLSLKGWFIAFQSPGERGFIPVFRLKKDTDISPQRPKHFIYQHAKEKDCCKKRKELRIASRLAMPSESDTRKEITDLRCHRSLQNPPLRVT